MDELINKEKKHVSFSQFSWYLKCPRKFYIDNVLGLKEFEDNINTCFGTAIHEALQHYIKILYTEGVQQADDIDLYKFFKDMFEKEIENKKVKCNEDDLTDFIFDGEDIINEFLKTNNRIKHFPRDKYELVDIEHEIKMDIKNNVEFVAYLDLVLKEKNTGIIKILDFKTSTYGWNSYTQDDCTKTSQLLLYKAFYSRKFNIPLNKIEVEFFILKRKLYENANFPQQRLQNFTPNNNKKSILSTINTFIDFINECFTPDGNYKENEKDYPKNPGEKKKHCKYCPHKKIRCDQKPEIVD